MAAYQDESDFPIEQHLSTTKDADNTTEKEQAQLAGLADQQRARPRKEGLAQEAAGTFWAFQGSVKILAPHSMAILPSRPTGSLLSPGPRSHREVMLALVMTYAAVTLELVSTTDATFFGGKFLNGFAIGFLQSVTVTYIGDQNLTRYQIPNAYPGSDARVASSCMHIIGRTKRWSIQTSGNENRNR
ncbi:hypothetical protein M0657_006222 [Pyricularia oryzae]|nr:hypothetical protein M0657_006222 [Pyricularia oryzae]KAI7924748.1 hypothetical protein M9X92_003650 [Pyricularia oryzae]